MRGRSEEMRRSEVDFNTMDRASRICGAITAIELWATWQRPDSLLKFKQSLDIDGKSYRDILGQCLGRFQLSASEQRKELTNDSYAVSHTFEVVGIESSSVEAKRNLRNLYALPSRDILAIL